MTPQLIAKMHVRPAFAAAGEGVSTTRPAPWAERRTDKWPVADPTAAVLSLVPAGNCLDKLPLTEAGVDSDKWPVTKSDFRHEKWPAGSVGALSTTTGRADKWPLELDKWPLEADKWPLN